MPQYIRARVITEVLYSLEEESSSAAENFASELGDLAVDGILSNHADVHFVTKYAEVTQLLEGDTVEIHPSQSD